MKKIIISLAFAALSVAALAIPAKPGWRQFTQPDGSTIELRLVGDEFGHALIDRSGTAYSKGADGFYRPSDVSVKTTMHKAAARRAKANQGRARTRAKASEKISGSPHIPVLLVEFSDQKFKTASQLSNVYSGTPQEAFSSLLNQSGYSYNGATGSVRDFYIDNSNEVYTPVFDVLKVVTLSKPMATYGGNNEESEDEEDLAPELAVYEAVKALDSTVDFSQYDYDGDGEIDMILMYYAGFNEAEGGDSDTIWPHQWSVQYSDLKDGSTYIAYKTFDGKRIGKYFCTSELSFTSNTQGVLCGIGTTCHEFAHSLGLPDFYDSDYTENYICGATYSYDTMCDGPYNNGGNTPPFFNAEELIMLGWMDALTELPTRGSVTIPALSKTNKVAYKGASSTDGEYFVFECRGSDSWDKYIIAEYDNDGYVSGYKAGPGMLVYHVDKSKAKKFTFQAYEYNSLSEEYEEVTVKKSPSELWAEWENYNNINAFGDHPCFYIIPAGCQNYNYDTTPSTSRQYYYYGKPSATTGLHYSGSDFTFGTSSKYAEYTPVDWNKKTMDYTLKNISYASGSVSFSVGADLCYIAVPSGSLKAGNTLALSLEGAPSGSKASWFWDDTALSGSSVTLTEGKHLIEAKVTSGSKTLRLELEIEVK